MNYLCNFAVVLQICTILWIPYISMVLINHITVEERRRAFEEKSRL